MSSSCGGCEAGIEPQSSGTNEDHKVLVDGLDTTATFLAAKIVAGAGITFTVLNPGANEQIRVTGLAGVTSSHDRFVAALAQTLFVLTTAPSSTAGIQVFVNGVSYDQTTDWTIAIDTVTWLNTDFALGAGDIVDVYYPA